MAMLQAFFGRRRSQTSAPIELLIAVVVMAMSLAIAYYLWSQIDCARCLAEQKGEGQKLADAMHAVSLGFAGTKQSVSYTMRSCCSLKVDGVRFSRYSSREFCGKCLGSFGKGCWKIEPVGYDQDGHLAPFSDADVCVDMSESLEVADDRCTSGAAALVDSPCPNMGTNPSACQDQQGLKQCHDGSWDFPDGTCSGGGGGLDGIARFKTLQRTETAYSFDVNLSKTSIAGGGVGMLVCAAPRG